MNHKNSHFSLRISASDLKQIRSRSMLAGLSMSEYIRRKALSNYKGPSIVIDTETIQTLLIELKRCGNNINQIAHILNRHQINASSLKADINDALADLTYCTEQISNFITQIQKSL